MIFSQNHFGSDHLTRVLLFLQYTSMISPTLRGINLNKHLSSSHEERR